jgi:hypothetical protein
MTNELICNTLYIKGCKYRNLVSKYKYQFKKEQHLCQTGKKEGYILTIFDLNKNQTL